MSGTPGAIRQTPVAAGNLGQGIKYPIRYTAAGRLDLSFGTQSVLEAAQSICSTQPGERVMEPEYGAAVGLFEPIDAGRLTIAVQQNIAEHEPHIESTEVNVDLGPTGGGQMVQSVGVIIRGEATVQYLTFPIFVGP